MSRIHGETIINNGLPSYSWLTDHLNSLLQRRNAFVRYAVCIGAVGMAFLLTKTLQKTEPNASLSFVFFFAAVAVSAGAGGFGPGVLATLLSALLCDYFFLPPTYSLYIGRGDIVTLLLFVLAALVIIGVSERLRARTRAADRRFHDLVQALDGIVWEADPRTGRFLFVSRRAEDILNYPVSHWLSKPDFPSSIIHPDDRQDVASRYREAVETGQDRKLEYRALDAEGAIVWLRETVRVLPADAAGPARMAGLSVDITERKNAVKELAAVRDELEALNTITVSVGNSLDLKRVLDTLQTELKNHLKAAQGAIYLTNLLDEDLHLERAWDDEQAALRPSDVLPRSSLASKESPELEHKSNARTSAQLDRLAMQNDIASDAYETLVASLVAHGELQGGLLLYRHKADATMVYGVTFLEALGRQVGVVIQNARLYGELAASQERLHLLSQRLVIVQEAERREIARELHDEIGQALTGLKLSLEMSTRLFPAEGEPMLRSALGVVNELMVHVRELSLDLRPAMLDDLGILPTLIWYFGRYTGLTHVEVRFEHTGLDRRFSHEIETTSYRIVQEALTNAARYAGVQEVTVRLWSGRDFVGVQVIDRGNGFDPEAALFSANTGGLAGMQERAELLGGRLTIESSIGQGTSLTAELPLGGSGL